ncbi:hypothetical protein [Saccharopolyspora sp. ASAGF58]|uniref:hypothetical protein n=1 Tax=Saccharopolyspora sp. ASAGF58 TaxID=2719023 RepID=UPI0014400C24|nr:hypothetical protein [Saccharopolyspora sp. ASAGF58]QIZ36948.1 hypothetical protein FDZ84_22725 [Saccharopolyspora sp. ASAGF58]
MSTARGWLSRRKLDVETDQGLLVVDRAEPRSRTGRARRPAAARRRPDPLDRLQPRHLGYDYGVPAFLADGERLGDAGPAIIAQENVVRRYRRYAETAGLQARLNSMPLTLGITGHAGAG